MYTSCAFCGARLAGDGGPSGLTVGRRLAFDEWRGRLWVICPRCARWNLTPLADRLERIEALARAAREGTLLAATDHVALVRWKRYELIRVGQPPRMELAGWRYGERLRRRRRERALVVVPLTVAAVGLVVAANVAAGGSFGFAIWNFGRLADGFYVGLVGRRRVHLDEPPICERCGRPLELPASEVQHARLVPDARHDVGVLVRCPACQREASLLTGAAARALLRPGLAYLNLRRSSRRRAEEAARALTDAGGPHHLLRDISRGELPLRSLRPERQLALEMAVDEQAELEVLERQWREAEEIAAIADGPLSTTPELEQALWNLKQGVSQPSG
jgi:hypothetical protein